MILLTGKTKPQRYPPASDATPAIQQGPEEFDGIVLLFQQPLSRDQPGKHVYEWCQAADNALVITKG